MTPEGMIIEQMFSVVSKEGTDVPFKLNKAQRQIDENLTGRDIIPKARQEGVSTYFLGRYAVKCMAERNVSAVVVSHDSDSTTRMFSRVSYFLDNLRSNERPELGRDAANTITFPKTNSRFFIGTAGSRKFGRGDTITHLHCSEYAFWPQTRELTTGLFQAVPATSGEIAIESTGNGMGNDYYRRVKRAHANQSRFRCHFLPWHTFPEYSLDLTPEEEEWLRRSLDPVYEEDQLADVLTLGQLAWRRMKLEELDYDIAMFKQEYPMSLDECFQATSRSLFTKVRLIISEEWSQKSRYFWSLDPHPIPSYHYIIGADVGAGVGQDNSVGQIICLETGQQVGEYARNDLDPDIFGDKLCELGTLFNHAYLTVENNNHGIITCARIRDNYEGPYYEMHTGEALPDDRSLGKIGLRTTTRTKPLIIGMLRSKLAKEWVIHSSALKIELDTFIEKENGKQEAEDGCKDDRVMAMCMAAAGANEAALQLAEEEYEDDTEMPVLSNPFKLEGIVNELRGRGYHRVFRKQV